MITDRTLRRSVSRSERVLSLLTPAAGPVYLSKVSSTLYRFARPVGDDYFAEYDFRDGLTFDDPTPGGYSLLQMDKARAGFAAVSSPAMTRSGAGWGTVIPRPEAYNGEYWRTDVAGAYVEMTAPAGSTRLVARFPKFTNGGVATVAIGGDLTAATGCSTAQQLVDAGELDPSALTTGGGSILPTTRCINQWASAAAPDSSQILTTSIAPAAHVVRLTCSGYKHPSSTDVRLYVSGLAAAAPATTLETTGATVAAEQPLLSTIHSAYEYAFSGGTFFGNIHGFDEQTAIAFAADGGVVSLADGDTISADVIVVTRTSTLRDPSSPATVLGTAVVVYTLTSSRIRIQTTITWSASKTLVAAYLAMYPLDGSFRKAFFDTGGVVHTLTNDGGTVGKNRGRMACLYVPGGKYGAALWIPDPATTVNGWVHSSFGGYAYNNLNVESRTVAALAASKVYATRVAGGSPEAVVNGSVWRSDSSYYANRLDVADVLAAG